MDEMKPRKKEPSLREKLSAAFLEALTADFAVNGAAVIEKMRTTHPERYAELAAKLIMSAEPQQDPTGLAGANTMEEVGRKLLQSIGLIEPTDEQIEAAIEANDKFVARLEAIRDTALQFEEELTNGNAELGGLN
jgi:hypothetical protein